MSRVLPAEGDLRRVIGDGEYAPRRRGRRARPGRPARALPRPRPAADVRRARRSSTTDRAESARTRSSGTTRRCRPAPCSRSRTRDWIFPAYRESAIGLLRGMPVSTVLSWWRGHPAGWWNPRDYNVASICVPIATQIPHAVGFAWGSRLKGEDRVALDAVRGRRDFRRRVPRGRDVRRGDEGAGRPLLQQQPVGDLDPALRADGGADARRQGDRLRDTGRARRRRRRPRRVRGDAGGGLAGARGRGADLHRGRHLPRRASRDCGRPVDLHRLRARRGREARTSASAATSATSCGSAC